VGAARGAPWQIAFGLADWLVLWDGCGGPNAAPFAMKALSLLLTFVLLLLTGAALVPDLADYTTYLVGGAAGVAFVLLVLGLVGGKAKAAPSTLATPAHAPAPKAPRAEAEMVGLLAALQDKGRLVDFLMEDVTSYQDAQVGAAARVVHQGCLAVLKEHFEVQPMLAEAEGSTVTVPAEHAADAYRLTGNLSGAAPFSGTLTHKGWKATTVRLPQLMENKDGSLPAIAPAEVEVK
jgi:hypothetical protein